jgi:hypothetical protein
VVAPCTPLRLNIPLKGGTIDLKVGGDKVCERSKQKILFDPHSWLSGGGGTKNLIQYCKVDVVVFANFEESCLLVARFARKFCTVPLVFCFSFFRHTIFSYVK